MTSARVIADSLSPGGHRLTTMVVRMHRFVLAEFNTHRQFSRSSASSRAIPVRKMLESVKNDPAFPISWPAEQSGMQGGEELDWHERRMAQFFWEQQRDETVRRVENYLDTYRKTNERLHKSVLNRLLEPFLWHEVIVSSTEWDNFFRQRCSPLAQPEMRAVAEEMRNALSRSEVTPVGWSDWHTPFITDAERREWEQPKILRISVARCARVSYLNHEGQYDPEADEALFRRLVTADPPHLAPLEMVAQPTMLTKQLGNFEGWRQLRHMTPMILNLKAEARGF